MTCSAPSRTTTGWLQVPRSEFLPAGEDADPFHERIVHRPRRSLNLRGTPLEPKVAQRPAAADRVAPGNHSLVEPRQRCAPDIGAVEVLHFPMRSYAQFERKVLRNGIGHETNPQRRHPNGIDQLALLDAHREGRLREHWDERIRMLSSARDRELVCDERLRQAFATPTGRTPDSPAIADGFRRAYASHAQRDAEEQRRGAAAATRAAADARNLSQREAAVAHLTAALERSQARERALESSLETIRGSATMRYTAWARRVYYRLRDTSRSAAEGEAVS